MRYKKLTAVILTALIVLSLMPVSALAEGERIYEAATVSQFDSAWGNARKNGGTIRLTADITITKEYDTDEGDKTFTLDLNGHALKGNGTSSDYMILVAEYVTLYITDSSEDQSGYMQVIKTGESYDEMILDLGTLYLQSGTLKGNSDKSCRVIYIDDEVFNTYDGKFVMNGGTISGNVSYDEGSAVHIEDGEFIMNGGLITGNRVVLGNGGAVYVDSDETFKMYGGTISGNKAENYTLGSDSYYGFGGGIYSDEGNVYIYGGTITDNEAGLGGGIFSDEGGKLTISGDPDSMPAISANKASRGGGIYCDDSTLVIKNCVMENNRAQIIYSNGSYAGEGGALWLDGNGTTVPVENCIIRGNSSNAWGGAFYLQDGYVRITDSTLTGNSSIYGGAVFLSPTFDELYCNGSTVMTDNTCTVAGGAIFVQSDMYCDVWDYIHVYFGGKVRIAGNYYSYKDNVFEEDVYFENPKYNYMKFQDDIDTTAADHAWIGISGQTDGYDIRVLNATEKRMTTIFGVHGYEAGLNAGTAYLGKLTDMTSMKPDEEQFVTTQGQSITSDKYTAVIDQVNCRMTLTTYENVSMDGTNVLITPLTVGLGSKITIESFDFFGDEEGNMTYKYVYRVHSVTDAGSKVYEKENEDVSRDVYWYVTVIKPVHYLAEVDGVKYRNIQDAYTASYYKDMPMILLDDAVLPVTGRDSVVNVIEGDHTLTLEWTNDSGETLIPIASVDGDVTVYTVPYVYAKSVSTKGELLMNFYLKIDKSVDPEMISLKMKYEGADSYTKTVPLSSFTRGSDGYYRISVPVPAKEMGAAFTLWLCDPDETVYYGSISYSVEEYYRGRLQRSDDPIMRNLSAAALNYGAAAQMYFNWNTDLPVNEGIEETFRGRFDLSSMEAPEVPDPSWEIYEKTGDIEGFVFYGQTVVFKEQPVLRFYLDLDQINIEDLSFSSSMGTLKDPAYNESEQRYYVDVTDISARNIMQPVTLTVTKGEETTSLTYSISTYIYRKYNEAGGLGDLVKAMYTYCLAAKAWAER